MGKWEFTIVVIIKCFLFIITVLSLLKTCRASVQHTGSLDPPFNGTQMYWIDNNGVFLLSNNTNFGFGFAQTQNDVTLFLLAVVHLGSSTVVWAANRALPVTNRDTFAFDATGNAFLQSGDSTVWSTNTGDKAVSSMELWDSGNLVLVDKDRNPIWQSFSYPTNTLLSNQRFSKGMKLASDPGPNNLNYTLEIGSNDAVLSANFSPPQPYWSVRTDTRLTINKDGSGLDSAVLVANSWNFYDSNDALLWQFIFSDNPNANVTWAAVLGPDGSIVFGALQSSSSSPSSTKIPRDDCSKPSACDPYFVCIPGNQCQCPSSIVPSCKSAAKPSPCKGPVELASGGNGVSYPALQYVPPSSSNATLDSCKSACLENCSCSAMFFEGSSGNCFLFDRIGSLVGPGVGNGANYTSFIKIPSSGVGSGGGSGGTMPVAVIVAIAIATLVVISGMIFLGLRIYKRKGKKPPESPKESSEEDNFLEGLSGMPIRFSYKELQAATDDFSVKLGQGGFGSVYRGALPDGTRVAVKKLEGIGQGKKEFRAEVSIIGSIHHVHLVRLRGFCAEGSHRLLAYEYMPNGSLDRWLFRKKDDGTGGPALDWDTRYEIAVGTARGLAYLHEDCDAKIVHCDIKPENVLLDERFAAKVSDFGLAKLMSREQSHVFTTLRGTRGYLAPEWITNYAISEKSDVYSYGMVLLELVGGRKNYDPREGSEKSHFPSYAFKMLEEGRLRDVLDSRLEVDGGDPRVDVAIRVALWCVQDDMHLRPSMAKVVQMLEGVCSVPVPPVASPLGSRLYATFLKSTSEEGTTTSSGPSDCNSDAYISAVRLSGPR